MSKAANAQGHSGRARRKPDTNSEKPVEYNAKEYLKFRPKTFNSKVERDVSIEQFHKELYAEMHDNQVFVSTKEALRQQDSSKITFVTGYAGCGKSVFVTKLFHEILTEGDDVKSIYPMLYDIEANRLERISYDRVLENLLKSIVLMVADQLHNKKSLFNKFRMHVQSMDEQRFKWNGYAQYFVFDQALVNKPHFGIAKEKLTTIIGNSMKKILESDVRDHTDKLLSLIMFDLFFRYFMNNNEKSSKGSQNPDRHLYVAYDNLDLIVEAPHILGDIIAALFVGLGNISDYAITRSESIVFRIIVATRKATYGVLTNEAASSGLISGIAHTATVFDLSNIANPVDVSGQYRFVDIIKKRLQYLDKRKKDKRPLAMDESAVARVEQMRQLNSIAFVENQLGQMFNYNYRECIDQWFHLKDNPMMAESIRCMEYLISSTESNQITDDEKETYYGASSLLLGTILNDFAKNELFTKYRLLELTSDAHCYRCDSGTRSNLCELSSTTRVVLTYLYNMQKSGTEVRLNDLFHYFKNIYSTKCITDVVKSLITHHGRWRRLLYVKEINLRRHSENCIADALDKMCSGYENRPLEMTANDYALIEICEAGKAYVDTIASHFEFFSVRCSKRLENYKPLFSVLDISSVTLDGDFPFDMIIKRVRKSVEACIQRLTLFADEFCRIKNITEYRDSDIVGSTRASKRQTHEERIIFQHIYFIEDYRWYIVCKNSEISHELRVRANEHLLGHICEYLKLFDQVKSFNLDRLPLREKLAEKAKSIEENMFDDFTTQIKE